MEIFKKITYFFNKHYWLFLFLVILISYGQILGMYVWKDDNAIFFKFNHIEEKTGYLGRGIFGEGPYRFTVTPYWLIYKVFGYEQVTPYYLLTLIFFFLSSLSVYKLFSIIISPKVGKVAGLLFASGYIASEGFMWLASSMIQSVSIILACLTLIFYSKFARKKETHFFLISLFFYFLILFLTPVRSHYFIGVIILFDLLWIVKRINLKNIFLFFIRSGLFFGGLSIFYLVFKDQRISLPLIYIKEILSGDLYKVYSFFGSLGNMFIPDKQSQLVISILTSLGDTSSSLFLVKIILIFLSILLVFLSSRENRKRKYLLILIILLDLVWFYFYQTISNVAQIHDSATNNFAFFLGGLFLNSLVVITIIAEKARKYIIFLGGWIILNLFAYASYLPTSIFSSPDRYLAHSLVPLVALLSCVFLYQDKKIRYLKILYFMVILWGVVNLYNSLFYQHDILLNRSQPAREFYKQLKIELPILNKGDVIYFDVSDNALRYFESAFSVGQMPETTAIAWRYGLDRYDFKMFTNFDDFKKEVVLNKVDFNKIHTFFYSKDGLVDTSSQTRTYFLGDIKPTLVDINLFKFSNVSLTKLSTGTKGIKKDLTLDLKPIISIVPVRINFNISAKPIYLSSEDFPYYEVTFNNDEGISKDTSLRLLAFNYKKWKLKMIKQADFKVSSQWMDRIVGNLHDLNNDTFWQADRVLWQKRNESIVVDLKESQDIDKVVWVNGLGNNTPTEYSIELSPDGINWENVRTIHSVTRIDSKEPQIIEFKSHKARFLRMVFRETISGDSPTISEIWAIPENFDKLNIKESENFLKNPYSFVPDRISFDNSLSGNDLLGDAQVFWQSNKQNGWVSKDNFKIPLIYDSAFHRYEIILPAGGMNITGIKLSSFQIPGEISIQDISIDYPKLGGL